MRNFLFLFSLIPGCFQLCPAGQTPSPERDRCVWLPSDDGGADADADADAPDAEFDADASQPLLNGGAIAVQVQAGNSCELFANGRVACWGWNEMGQHGAGHTNPILYPEYVDGIPPALEITVSGTHACARAETDVWCWGNNGFGPLGTGQVDPASTVESFPTPVPAYSVAQHISAGAHHTCLIDGLDAFCWGVNTGGQFGAGNTNQGMGVTPVELNFDADAVWAREDMSCYRETPSHRIYCAGTGIAPLGVPAEPVAIRGRVLESMSHGGALSCGIEAGTREVLCWGDDVSRLPPPGTHADVVEVAIDYLTAWVDGGALSFAGQGSDAYHYHALTGLTGVTAISLSNDHGCYIQRGVTYCWGYNSLGDLGNDSETPSDVPVRVLDPVE